MLFQSFYCSHDIHIGSAFDFIWLSYIKFGSRLYFLPSNLHLQLHKIYVTNGYDSLLWLSY